MQYTWNEQKHFKMWCPYVPKKLKCIIFAFVIQFLGGVTCFHPLCKNIAKICSNITMVEVQTWTPLENNTLYANIFGPLVVCFHPIMGTNCMILSKFHIDSYALFWTNVVIANFVMVNEWNFFRRIPQYSPLAMANWCGPLHEAFGNDIIHVV